jgi:hypothetical protein
VRGFDQAAARGREGADADGDGRVTAVAVQEHARVNAQDVGWL